MITFEEFNYYMTAIKDEDELQDKLTEAISEYNRKQNMCMSLVMPSQDYVIVDLLAKIFDDQNEWISYWVYKLDCGRKYEDGTVTDKDGGIIKLKTIGDLWNLLISEKAGHIKDWNK